MLHHHWYSKVLSPRSSTAALPGHLGVVGRHPRCGRTAGEGSGESQGAFALRWLVAPGPVVEPLTTKQQAYIGQLVGAFKHFLFSIIYGIIIPTDFHIFQRGWNHQPARYFMIFLIYTSQEMPWNVPPYPDISWLWLDISPLSIPGWHYIIISYDIHVYIYIPFYQVNISTYPMTDPAGAGILMLTFLMAYWW